MVNSESRVCLFKQKGGQGLLGMSLCNLPAASALSLAVGKKSKPDHYYYEITAAKQKNRTTKADQMDELRLCFVMIYRLKPDILLMQTLD